VTEEKRISKAPVGIEPTQFGLTDKPRAVEHRRMEPLVAVTPPSIPLRFVVGLAAGVLAVLAMDLVMPRLPEGETTPFVASGVLTDTPPDAAPARLATVVHYLAGLLTGPLFVWLLLSSETLLGGPGTVPALAAAAVLYVLMVAFFAVVVLPQSRVADNRRRPIVRDWAVCAAVYVVVLVPVVVGGSLVLVG